MYTTLQLDANSRIKDSGAGQIYMDFRSFQFPEKHWFDLTFMVLPEWTGSLFPMLVNNETCCVLSVFEER